MKLILLSLFLYPVLALAETNTGKTISGPETIGHPTYPTSGQTRSRSNDMTGEDMSNSTHMGSDQDPRVPTDNPTAQGSSSKKKGIRQGPYQDEKRLHREEGPDGLEAQEAAEDGFDISKEDMKRKQQGE